MNPLPSRLLAVTDRHQLQQPLADRVAELMQAGLRWIWLRDRDLPGDERRELAEGLRTETARAGATLTIGADIALAEAVGATAVHVRHASEVAAGRRRLGPQALLGVSAHALADVRAAAEAEADYVTLSPIFASASKPGYGPALGLAALAEAASLGIPVLALGGVTTDLATECRAAGAAGIAVMGPLMRGGPGVDARRTAGAYLVALGRQPAGLNRAAEADPATRRLNA